MKPMFIGLIAGLLVGGAGAWAVLHRLHEAEEHEAGDEKDKEKKGEEVSHVQHGTNGEVILKLDAAAQKQAGLKVAPLAKMQLPHEVKAFGRVLDPTTLATGLGEMVSAQAQLEVSMKEFERLKILHEENQNVSARAFEAAQAAARRDRALAEAAQVRFAAAWGKAIASRPDLDRVTHALVSQQMALIRVDVPAGDTLPEPPTAGRIAPLTAEEHPAAAELVGPAPSVDPQTQGTGYLFLLKTGAPPPNAAVVAWLSLPGDAEQGVLIPRSAIVRHEGEAFVYFQTGEETFIRQEVELAHPLEEGWFAPAEGLPADPKVVLAGAQQLLSEELKGEGGGE